MVELLTWETTKTQCLLMFPHSGLHSLFWFCQWSVAVYNYWISYKALEITFQNYQSNLDASLIILPFLGIPLPSGNLHTGQCRMHRALSVFWKHYHYLLLFLLPSSGSYHLAVLRGFFTFPSLCYSCVGYSMELTETIPLYDRIWHSAFVHRRCSG